MELLRNHLRPNGLDRSVISGAPLPSVDAATPLALMSRCPEYARSPLVNSRDLAMAAGVSEFWLKDERARMGLGSFKALGAAYVIAHIAQTSADMSGDTFVTASAGNHGLSVAAGGKVFGAKSVIFISNAVPQAFATLLAEAGADVRRAGDDYQGSMDAAAKAARDNGWTLLSDSSWPGYFELPHRLMEGYLVMAAEVADQMADPPTHVFLQAGVGGLGGAVAAYLRHVWGDGPRIVVVEPDAAPALMESIRAGRVVTTTGPPSTMGRLDCKEPSLIALAGLARDADDFLTISDACVDDALPVLKTAGFATSPSGGAGAAVVLSGDMRDALGLNGDSRVLTILSEGDIK
jgi:diaminopropionate ammonia-lyase